MLPPEAEFEILGLLLETRSQILYPSVTDELPALPVDLLQVQERVGVWERRWRELAVRQWGERRQEWHRSHVECLPSFCFSIQLAATSVHPLSAAHPLTHHCALLSSHQLVLLWDHLRIHP